MKRVSEQRKKRKTERRGVEDCLKPKLKTATESLLRTVCGSEFQSIEKRVSLMLSS